VVLVTALETALLIALRALFDAADAHDADAWNWESAAAMDLARGAIAAAENPDFEFKTVKA
jgi:hypothetical protein